MLRPGGTKVIGGEEKLTLYRTELQIESGDKLILASDGVSDNVHVSELVDIIRKAASPEEAAQMVAETCLRRDHPVRRVTQRADSRAVGRAEREQYRVGRGFGGVVRREELGRRAQRPCAARRGAVAPRRSSP